jgi:Phosphoesterase family
VRRNPPPYQTTLSDCARDVPSTQLATDLANNTLPAFLFITPNVISDMHNGTIQQGDTWLSTNPLAIFPRCAARLKAPRTPRRSGGAQIAGSGARSEDPSACSGVSFCAASSGDWDPTSSDWCGSHSGYHSN